VKSVLKLTIVYWFTLNVLLKKVGSDEVESLFFDLLLLNCEVLCASVLVKSGLENRDYGHRGSTALIMRHPSIRKRWH
jgi:hypothetical protein